MKRKLTLGLLILAASVFSANAKGKVNTNKNMGNAAMFACAGGLTTCGISYMVCDSDPTPWSSADGLVLNDYLSLVLCGDTSVLQYY